SRSYTPSRRCGERWSRSAQRQDDVFGEAIDVALVRLGDLVEVAAITRADVAERPRHAHRAGDAQLVFGASVDVDRGYLVQTADVLERCAVAPLFGEKLLQPADVVLGLRPGVCVADPAIGVPSR